MKVEIKNGDLFLTKSDTILVYDNQEVTLTFDEQYTLIFHFMEDSTEKDNKMDIEHIDGGVKLNLINFNNPIGTATGKPIPFATANNKQVYVSFAVYSIGKSKVLHYNIHIEK